MQNSQAKAKVEEFFSQYKKLELSEKKVLLRPLEPIEYVYYLKSGFVRQYSVNKNGEDINLHIFTEGSYIPMMLLLSGFKNKYYFETVEKVEIYRAPASEVLEFVKNNSDVLFDLSVRLAEGLCGLLIKSETTLYQDAYKRVIHLLLFMGRKFGEKVENKVMIKLPLTHADIASWIGIQRETASRQLELLINKNIISQKKQTITLDLDLLEKELKVD